MSASKLPWQQLGEEMSQRMSSVRTFGDYPSTESGDEEAGTYGGHGRKPFSPIVEEDEETLDDSAKKQKMAGGVAGGVTGGGANKKSPSPKQQSLSPSSHSSGSSDHSSSRSPPTYPPPPTSVPPPLPMSQARSHTHHSPVSGPASKYGGHPLDHTHNGRGGNVKPHPHHPLSTYQNQNDRFKQLSGSHSTKSGTYPTKQQVSGSHSIKPGSRMNHTDVVVNSKVIPSKQYTTLLDQSNQECVSEPLPLNPLESGGDLGVRECPSGASSPSSGTPNNTLSKSGKIPYHMDPLASSASENRLGGHPGGPNRGGYHDAMETHSDSNLLDYSSSHYTEVGMASRGQGKVKQPHKMMAGSSVKGSSSDWEVRGDHGDHEGALPGRVLHPISKERVKVGGEQGVASPVTNGYAGVGKGSRAKSSVSPEHHPGGGMAPEHHPGGGVAPEHHPGGVAPRPSSSDSGYGPSSSSAHSLSPLQPSHTSTEQPKSAVVADHTPSIGGVSVGGSMSNQRQASGGVSPSSSTEELTHINEKDETLDLTSTSTSTNTTPHHIHKPEPTKSTTVGVAGSYPTAGMYANKQTTPQAPPPGYHPSEQAHPSYQHTASLSQPMPAPGPQMTSHTNPPTSQISLSQGPYYQHHHPNSRGDSAAPPPAPPYGNSGPAPPYGGGYGRKKIAYENVPMVYDSLQGRHLPHPQHAGPPGKYGGMAQQAPHQQPGGYNPRDGHVMKPHPEYTPMMRPPYSMGAGSRWKNINPASIAVAHDAAASGDIATLHHMLTNQDIDGFTFTEHKFSLAHKAALHGQLGVLSYLVNDTKLPLTALQLSDDSFSTPAMLAIQGGHVECVQWMVEECKVPLEVRDTGGETLMHHAAYNGQVKCLEWLLKTIKKKDDQQHIEILDESGVSPSHFAAQGGHLDCLQLLIDHGYSVVHADQEGQKPLDWADAMNQTVCVRYLMMYEACWALSAEVTHLSEQLVILRKEYDKVRETLNLQSQEHQHAVGKLQQSHEERIAKIREQYVDFTASLLKNTGSSTTSGGGGGASGSSGSGTSTASSKAKSQTPSRKAPSEPPHRRGKPPIPPESSNTKKHSVRSGQSHEHKDDSPEVDYRTVTPQEVMKKQLSSVAHRMSVNREHRKHHGGGLLPRNYSPLTPIIQRYSSKKGDEEMSKSDRQLRPQRYAEAHDKRGVAQKAVKFANTVTEFPSRFDEDSRTTSKSAGHKFGSSHPGSLNHSSPGHSPGHVPGHASLGQYNNDRTVPDGESGHGKSDNVRKTSDK